MLLVKLVFLCIIFNVLYVESVPFYHRPEKYCGDDLARILSLICKGNYNSPEKKSTSDLLNYSDEVTDYENNLNPFGPPKIRRGIVSECCHRACSYEELQLYCGTKK